MFLASASYLLKRRRRAAFAVVLGAIFAAGALTIQVRGSNLNQGTLWLGDGDEVTVTAHVIAEGDVQPEGPGSWHQRIDVETEQVESDTDAKQSQAVFRFWSERLNPILAGCAIAFGVSELVVMSAVMQLGLALPMAYYFHRATSVAMPANLLIIPLLQVLMPATILAIITGYVSLTRAKIPAFIAGLALDGIAGTVKWLGGLRLADIRVPTPSLSAIIFAGIAISVSVILMRKRRWLAISGAALLATSVLWIWTLPPPPHIRPNILEMTAIDVGQSHSILLVLPEGRTLLGDTGGLPFWAHSQLDIGEDVVSPYLWSRGMSRIDVLVLTHAHADHMGGMPAMMANFRPRELWLPEGIPDDKIHKLLSEAHELGVSVVYRHAGDTFSYAER